jgi:hypothetical protein
MRTPEQYATRSKYGHGLSLIELLVALVLGVLLVGGLVLIYVSTLATQRDAEGLARIQENLRFGADFIVRDVRNAGFSDETGITQGENDLINAEFARTSANRTELTIRYAGRGSCATPFLGFGLVENQYRVSNDGRTLQCFTPNQPVVDLVDGVLGLRFELIRADGTVPLVDSACAMGEQNPCVGVRMVMTFEGLETVGVGSERETREVALIAAFRNVILPIVTREVDL